MQKSPLTDSVTEKKIGNSNFYEDSCGLWFNPSHDTNTEPEAIVRATNANEDNANQKLAEALHNRYVKKIGTVLDILNPNDSLLNCFKNIGYETASSNDALQPSKNLDLITSVHTFQYLNVRQARSFLQYAISALNPGGYVFIRMPDHDVTGHEQDVQKDFACFWNLYSFLELLDQVKFLRIVETYTIQPGQRDYFLQVFPDAPKICAGLIVKNEERDLPKCLESLEGVVDGLVIMDTGSVDKTMDVATQWAQDHQIDFHIEKYLGASEQDETGDWKLWDFGKARNQYVKKIDELEKFDWTLWMDADDIMRTPKELKNLSYLWNIGMHGVQITSGDLRWVHHRMWKTGHGVKYQGRCHEYPSFSHLPSQNHNHVLVFHDGAAGVGESANLRNLRILEREVNEAPTPRNCFYLANTHKDGGRYDEAVKYYQQRIDFGKGFEDEYWFAKLYLGRCLRLAKRYGEALNFLTETVTEKADWAEFWMELSYLGQMIGNRRLSLAFATAAMEMPIPPTSLFRERNKYLDQPYRVASFAAEALGDVPLALKYAEKAKEKIGGPDESWGKRISDLRSDLEVGERKKP